MSVTTTSYKAPSSFLLAASPEFTVSTLCPSRRKAMSSISQMERSSSQTRMLPMRSSSDGSGSRHISNHSGMGLSILRDLHTAQIFGCDQTAQTENKHAALARLRAGPHFALMGLHNLVDDGQPQPRATLKLRLERLENLVDDLRINARPGVGKIDLPIVTHCFHPNSKCASALHRTNRVFAEIPKYLLDLVSIGQGQRFLYGVMPFNANARVLRDQTMFQQGQRVLEQWQQIDFRKLILLSSRVSQEIGNDVIQPLGFPSDNLQQLTVLVTKIGNAGKHAYRPGDGRQRITNFVGDGSGEPSHRSQAVLHADFAFKTADF